MEYIFISSLQNSDLFPENTWHDFHVELPKELVFKSKCECALLFFDVNPLFNLEVNIFCDLLEEHCFEDSLAPFLSPVFEVPLRVENPIFVPLRQTTIKRIRISIKKAFTHSTPTESIQQSNLLLLVREAAY